MLSVQDPVRFLKGVGPAKEALLDKLGIRTVRDLLYHFPRAYQHRAQIKLLKDGMDGNAAAFLLTVQTQPRHTVDVFRFDGAQSEVALYPVGIRFNNEVV